MKKFFALLLAAAMLCCLVAVPAAADGVVTFTAATVNDVNPGDTVSVPVSISAPGGYEAHTLRLHIRYDVNNLTVDSISNGTVWQNLPDDAMKVKDYTTVPGDISIGIVCPSVGMTGTGVFFTVNFVVADTCTQDQPIEVIVNEFSYTPLEGAGYDIEFATVNGAVNMAATEPDPTEPAPTEPVVEPTEPAPVVPGDMNANFAITPRTVAEDDSTITIALTVTGSYNAHTLNASVDFDTRALELVSVAKGAALENAPDDAAIIIDTDTVPGSVRLGLVAPSEGFTATGVLLNITFKVSANFSAQYPDGTLVTVDVTEFDYMPLGEATGVAIPCNVASGVVVPKSNGGGGDNPPIPITGAVSLIGLGVAAIASGACTVLFRRKED